LHNSLNLAKAFFFVVKAKDTGKTRLMYYELALIKLTFLSVGNTSFDNQKITDFIKNIKVKQKER